MKTPPSNLERLESLVEIGRILLGPGGCPWDREQNFKSLAPCSVEEVFELVDAIEKDDIPNMVEELGDVLYHIVFYSLLGEAAGKFNWDDVVRGISEKLVTRHPHVFSTDKVGTADEVRKRWEEIKDSQKKKSPEEKSLPEIPISLPALQRSSKIGSFVKKFLFDWEDSTQIVAKVDEEIGELKDAMSGAAKKLGDQDLKHIEEELGDVLFTIAQLARQLKLDPEQCLRLANQKFLDRWQKLIAKAGTLEKFKALSSSDKESLWQSIKN